MPRKRKQESDAPVAQHAAAAAAAPAPAKKSRAAGAKPLAASAKTPKVRRATVARKPVDSAAAADLMSVQEEIARLAYSYWEARGGQEGSPEDDWYRAEQEVRSRRKGKTG